MKHQIIRPDYYNLKTDSDVYNLLKEKNINYQLFKHRPANRVDEAKEITSHIPGIGLKSLLLKNKTYETYLIIVRQEIRLAINNLSKTLFSGRLSFCKEDAVLSLCGVPVGSVNPFCLLNAFQNKTNIVVDTKLKDCDVLAVHPMRNDRTITIRPAELWNIFINMDIKIYWCIIE